MCNYIADCRLPIEKTKNQSAISNKQLTIVQYQFTFSKKIVNIFTQNSNGEK